MKTRTGIIILLIAMVCALSLATPALASTTLNRYEKQLLALVNKERAKHGLVQLRVNDKLVAAARAHSADMGARKYFKHDTAAPNAESWSSRIIRYGYTRTGCSQWKAGENIFRGANLFMSPLVVMYGDDQDGRNDQLAKGWMDSAAHRAVILTKDFRDIGLGAVKTDTGYGNVDGTVWFFTLDVGRRVAQ
jgi:uncharacterized protein YkwD